MYVHIDRWRSKPLSGSYPYVYLDGIYLKRNGGGEYENVSVLLAPAVTEEGYREVIGTSEGMKEDQESRLTFLRDLKTRGMKGTRLFVGDKCRYSRTGSTSAAWCISTGTCSRPRQVPG